MSWLKECKTAAKALTREQRQAVLESVRAGKTLGSVAVVHGVTLQTVCGVVNMNLVNSRPILSLAETSK